MVTLPVGEDLPTESTLIRPAKMDSLHVIVQLLLIREVEVAIPAEVGLHLFVHAVRVDADVGLVGEAFPALATAVGLSLVVNSSDVLLERCLLREGPLA